MIVLYTTAANLFGPNAAFTLTVPGQYVWHLYSVTAMLTRAPGGTGTRTVTLVISDGTNTLARAPAVDHAPDPGDLVVCWSNLSPVEAVDNAPYALDVALPDLTLPAGYVVQGFVAGVAGDEWTAALAWWSDT